MFWRKKKSQPAGGIETRVKAMTPLYNMVSNSFRMCLVKSKGDKIVRKSRDFTNCKDHILDHMVASVHHTKRAYFDYDAHGPVHEGQLEIVFTTQKMPWEVLLHNLNGLAIAYRCIEQFAGWYPLSEGEFILVGENPLLNQGDPGKYHFGVYFKSPEQWYRYPQLLSLYLSLARCLYPYNVPLNINNFDKLCYYLSFVIDVHLKFERKKMSDGSVVKNFDRDIDEVLRYIIPYIYFLIKHEKKVLPPVELQEAYPHGLSHGDGGIVCFCRATTVHYRELSEKFRKFVEGEIETAMKTGGENEKGKIHERN